MSKTFREKWHKTQPLSRTFRINTKYVYTYKILIGFSDVYIFERNIWVVQLFLNEIIKIAYLVFYLHFYDLYKSSTHTINVICRTITYYWKDHLLFVYNKCISLKKKSIKKNNFHFGATTFEWSKFQKKIAQKNE